jgi:tRNA (guanine-N7-)-methyltransferase
MKKIRSSQHVIDLLNGSKLPYHNPQKPPRALSLENYLPHTFCGGLELEIGCGKGEFIANRAKKYPERFFIGIDRRKDRHTLTEKKLLRNEEKNWVLVHEDARCFLHQKIPPIQVLHVYHPDPWPKARHHKHRFFRSPEAYKWAQNIVSGGEFRISTDHKEYFFEILSILESWPILKRVFVYKKTQGVALTHFESIFLKKSEPVFKAHFVRVG